MDKYWSVTFRSQDSSITFSTVCYLTQKFSDLVEKLLKENEELKNNQLIFLYGGKLMDLDKTLEENRIKNGGIIIISKRDKNN